MFKKRVIKGESKAKRKDSFSEGEDETVLTRKPENELKKRKRNEENGKGIDSIGTPNSTVTNSKDTKSSDTTGESIVKDIGTDIGTRDSNTTDTTDAIATHKKGVPKGAPRNIRTVTITDFQPDVCKDFWQTGYCGYGDTCKFLHIRDESRQKKPIDKEWENVENADKQRDKQKHEKNLATPFKCVICKQDYTQPVRTECDHIFCRKCFIDRLKVKHKSTCIICGKDTNGIFSPVSSTELESLLV